MVFSYHLAYGCSRKLTVMAFIRLNHLYDGISCNLHSLLAKYGTSHTSMEFLTISIFDGCSAQGAGRLKDLPLPHQNHCPLCDQQETTQYIFASTVFYRFLVARFLTKGEGYCVMWLVADD